MSTRSITTVVASWLCLGGLLGCSAEHDSRPVETGSVELALSAVPDDVSCIAISASTNIGTNVERYDVSSGQTFSTLMEGLPFGDVQFSGESFAEACADLTNTTIPTWVSQPVNHEVLPGEVGIVTLVMRRNGKVCIEVTFEDDFGQVVEENGDAGLCALPAEPGPCRAALPRWFFNEANNRCERFVYGGCGGNANNFATLSACEDRCQVERTGCVKSTCDLPPGVAGPCDAAIKRWTFDGEAGECRQFIYGGCGGNANNFPTNADCERQCAPASDPCARLNCRDDQQCEVYEPTSEAYCADSCENRRCPSGQSCRLVPVQCVRAPCPPVAMCKETNLSAGAKR